MRIGLAIIGHYKGLGMNPITLHKQGQTVFGQTRIGHTIVAYQRESGYQDLSRITGIGQTLRIARHSGVEHHLASRIGIITERPATELTAIVKYQFCFSHLKIFTLLYN